VGRPVSKNWLLRYQDWLIIFIRFMYGLRVAGPIFLGMARVSPVRFAVVNCSAPIVWAVLIGGAATSSGEAVTCSCTTPAVRGLLARWILVLGIAVWPIAAIG